MAVNWRRVICFCVMASTAQAPMAVELSTWAMGKMGSFCMMNLQNVTNNA
jgi:hypothetical protein